MSLSRIIGRLEQLPGGTAFRLAVIRALFRIYPPYVGAGIRLTGLSPDFRWVTVEMPLRFWNRNYVGTQFGGSLYSMCDPFFMLIMLNALGSDYVVWDQSAELRFVAPGRSTVRARFHIEEDEIQRVKERADAGEIVRPVYEARIEDTEGKLVAVIHKRLYVRRKETGTGGTVRKDESPAPVRRNGPRRADPL